MPTIVNPYKPDTSLGEMIGKVAMELFGGDQIGNAVKREQYNGLRFSNAQEVEKQANRDYLAELYNKGGPLNAGQALGAAVGAGVSADEVGDGFRVYNSNTYDPGDVRVTQGILGSGGPMSGTPQGFGAQLGEVKRNNDMTDATSRANNAADNKRVFAAGLFDALPEGAVRPAVPGEVAGPFGLPALKAEAGVPKAQSETEWQAAQNERLRRSGQLTDTQIVEGFMGQRSPVEATDPATGKPVYMSPGAAVRAGAQPAPRGPSTVVNNNTGGETKYQDANGAGLSKWHMDAVEDGVTARTDLALLNRLSERMEKLPGGLAGGLQGFAAGWGVHLGNGASDAETANALIARLVPAARQGLPGASSDRDIALFKASLPSLWQSPEGRVLITNTLRGLASKRVQMGTIAVDAVTDKISKEDATRRMLALGDPFTRFRALIADGQVVVPTADASGDAARPSNDAEYGALPSGALFIDPDDGKTYRKP